MNDTEKWVNVEDVAEHLSISLDTVRTCFNELRPLILHNFYTKEPKG